MMELNLTNEELEALKYYKGFHYTMINQLLISNCEADIALLSDANNRNNELSYEKETVRNNIEVIKKMYELMQKVYYSKKRTEGWAFTRGTNIAEIERLKNELYIDKFLSTTKDKEKAKKEFSSIWNQPAIMYICGESNIPYIVVDEILEKSNENQEVIIAPFTKIKEIKEAEELELEDSSKTVRSYSVLLEKQELEELSEEERRGLYNYIIDNADTIDRRLQECIELEKENSINYENIRKLEQLLSKYEINTERKELEKDYSESERQADLDDIQRINKELDELKNISSEIFQIRKSHIDFITNWKKNIAVYMMAECREIELKCLAYQEIKEEKENSKIEVYKEEIKALENKTAEEIKEIVKKECKDNIDIAEKLLVDIQKLISKQQNHAKIAGNLETNYSALNNAFEIRKVAENLNDLLKTIMLKVESIIAENKEDLVENLKNISEVNLQISTLINYLNNPKIALKNSKVTRFDEMAIIEENELKKGIAQRIRDIRGEAELKKLKDDLEMLEEKGAISRFFGIFTGRNKLDDFMIEQIEIRKKAIRRTLSKKMSLAHNYSIHELVAEIRMFIEENQDDYLVEQDIKLLESIEKELKNNFVILDTKIKDIIDHKEGRNLPLQDKKISKKEIIEIETYRFLNKYGYDIQNKEETEDPVYKDTMKNEIIRIIDYINSSNIL